MALTECGCNLTLHSVEEVGVVGEGIGEGGGGGGVMFTTCLGCRHWLISLPVGECTHQQDAGVICDDQAPFGKGQVYQCLHSGLNFIT